MYNLVYRLWDKNRALCKNFVLVIPPKKLLLLLALCIWWRFYVASGSRWKRYAKDERRIVPSVNEEDDHEVNQCICVDIESRSDLGEGVPQVILSSSTSRSNVDGEDMQQPNQQKTH